MAWHWQQYNKQIVWLKLYTASDVTISPLVLLCNIYIKVIPIIVYCNFTLLLYSEKNIYLLLLGISFQHEQLEPK